MNQKTMTKELKQFFQIASQDQQMQGKLKAAPNREAYLNSCVELGREKGFSFTSDEVATALNGAKKTKAAKNELSEKELNTVAGGGLPEIVITKPAEEIVDAVDDLADAFSKL